MIGKNLQLERKKLNVTQEKMAEICDCKQSNISTIEKTENTSTIIKYMKFLREKGTDLNTIFDDK